MFFNLRFLFIGKFSGSGLYPKMRWHWRGKMGLYWDGNGYFGIVVFIFLFFYLLRHLGLGYGLAEDLT